MKKIFFILAGILVFNVQISFAHPPTNMKLTYDAKAGNLHIEMTHVTHDMVRHYIREIVITRNSDTPEILAFARQTTPTQMIQDVSLAAVPKDKITVKATCSMGGSGEESIIIPEEKKDEKKEEKK